MAAMTTRSVRAAVRSKDHTEDVLKIATALARAGMGRPWGR